MVQAKKSKYVSFRVTETQLAEIETAASDAGVKAREWCRTVVLERLGGPPDMNRYQRFLFQHLIRAQYLVAQGFQLLADNNLTSEEWKRLRANAKYRAPELAEAALASYAERSSQRS